MANTVLIGLQWGDEGKGKIIDYLTGQTDVVVRFQGGNNAGHTVEIGDEKFILHLIPSGILRPAAVCMIGNGVVVNPLALHEEMVQLKQRGVEMDGRLQVSTRCQLVFQYHCMLDGLFEKKLGDSKIGTTKRGIGPAYADKVNRVGIRAVDLKYPDRLEPRFRTQAAFYNRIFRDAGVAELDIDAEWERLRQVVPSVAPLVTDTVLTLNRLVQAGKEILFEGAQGAYLDVDYGTYPYVTSSNTTSGAACTGGGIAPSRIDRVIGVAKAYTTRVGSGPFPTEVDGQLGEFLRQQGGEFGATTGRPRRCGWFDAVATRYAVMLTGADLIAVTKLDVLDTLDTIPICTAYEIDGKRVSDMPSDTADIARAVPVYEELPGWKRSTAEVRAWDDFPAPAKVYLKHLADLVGARLDIISVGPKRDQTLSVNRD